MPHFWDSIFPMFPLLHMYFLWQSGPLPNNAKYLINEQKNLKSNFTIISITSNLIEYNIPFVSDGQSYVPTFWFNCFQFVLALYVDLLKICTNKQRLPSDCYRIRHLHHHWTIWNSGHKPRIIMMEPCISHHLFQHILHSCKDPFCN